MFANFTMPENRAQEINRLEELRLKRENSSLSDTISGLSTAFTNNNYIAKMYNYSKELGYSNNTEEDSVFIDSNNDDRIVEVIKQNDLDLTVFADLKEAKNQQHENWILQNAIEKKRKNKFMQEHLTSTQIAAGSITGMLLDLDTLAIGPTAAILGKAGKVSSVAKTTFGIEAVGAVAKGMVDEDYGLDDALIDVTIGTLIDTSIAKYLGGDVKKTVSSISNDVPKNEEMLQITYKREPIIAYGPDTNPIVKKIDDIENKILKFEKENNIEEAAKLRFEVQELRKELNRTPETVEPQYVKNRKDFFNNQKRTITGAKQADDFISKVELNIKSLNDKSKDIRIKLKKYNDIESSGKELTRGQKGNKTKLKNKLKENENSLKLEKEKLSQDINYNKIKAVENEMKQLERQVDMIAKNFEIFVSELKEASKDLIELDDVAKKDFIDSMGETVNMLVSKYPEKGKIAKNIFETIKYRKKGGLDLSKLSGKQKAMIIGASLGGTSLLADDGTFEDIGLSHIIMGVVLTAVIGPKALQSLQNNNIGNMIKSGYDNIKSSWTTDKIVNTGQTSRVRKTGERMYQLSNTWFNSTLQEIDSFKDAELSAFARKLLVDPIDGSFRPLEIEKNGMMRAKLYQFNSIMDLNYKKFSEEANINILDFNKKIETRELFNKEVSNVLDTGIPSGNKHIDDAASGIRKIFDEILDDAKSVGVKGANQIIPTNSYLPRMWNFNVISKILNATDKEGIKAFKMQLKNVIVGDIDDEKLDGLIDWFKNSSNFENKKIDDVFERLEELLNEGVTRGDVAEKLSTVKDKQSRLKARIEMDLSKFEDITFKTKDGEVTLGLDDIVERDIYNIVNSYVNQMYGSITLANASDNWKTVKAFEQELESLTNGKPEARETLEAVSNLILGRPIKQTNTKVQSITEAIKAVTFYKALGLVAFSMIPEMFKTVANAGLSMSLKNLGATFKKVNKETEAYRVIQDLTGLGTHQARDVLDLKGLDMSEYGEVSSKNWFTKTAKKLQEGTARYSGLVKLSDAFQRITSLKSATDLAKFINGENVPLINSRKTAYGINDDVIQMFKDDFKFDNKGDLLFVNKDGWSYQKKAVFNDIMWKMNQDITPETLLGTTGRWMRDSNVGKIFSFLLTYPINLFSTQMARDVHFADTRAVMNNFLTFSGSYLGLVARYEAEQREYDEDQLIMYSLMNLPVMSLVSSMRAIMDPASVGTLKEIKTTMDTISGQTWDELNGN